MGRQAESPLRPPLHVVVEVDPKNAFGVTAFPDEDVVEALRADRAHEPLGERVRLRGPDRGQDHLGALRFKHLIERSGELGVAIVPRKLTPSSRPSMARFLACWVT